MAEYDHAKFAADLRSVLGGIEALLLEKNRKYGDSALSPRRTFSKASAEEQIRVRLDDKLKRLESAQLDDDEDVLLDLMGYIVLLRIAKKREREGFDRRLATDLPPALRPSMGTVGLEENDIDRDVDWSGASTEASSDVAAYPPSTIGT